MEKRRTQDKGFSVVGVLVSSSLAVGLSLVVIAITKQLSQVTKTVETKSAMTQIGGLISQYLLNETACKNTIGSADLRSLTSLQGIRPASGTGFVYEKDHTYDNNTVEIKNIAVSDVAIQPPVIPAGGAGMGTLKMTVTLKKVSEFALGSPETVKTYDIAFDVNDQYRLTRCHSQLGNAVDAGATEACIRLGGSMTTFSSTPVCVLTNLTMSGSAGVSFGPRNPSGQFASYFAIHSNGNVGVGTPSTPVPNQKLTVNGGVQASAFLYSSDARLKEDFRPIGSPLSRLLALEGGSFRWKDSGKNGIGLIAQNVETVFPELVSEDPRGMKSVEYGNLVAVLIEAIKEQQKEITALKERMEHSK